MADKDTREKFAAAAISGFCSTIKTNPWHLTNKHMAPDVAASFNSNDISEYEITQKLIQCDVLLLDDLGTERISEYTQGKLYEIINRIDMAGSPTLLFSSNFGLVQPEPSLTTIYGTNNGARIVSRLEGLTNPLGDFPEIDMRKHP